MNEIEKLYVQVGCAEYNYYEDIKKVEFINLFTAEKQLEITKFLFQQGAYYAVDDANLYWFHITDDCENRSYKPFDEAIAECINNLWQDLTATEQEQIKEILKG